MQASGASHGQGNAMHVNERASARRSFCSTFDAKVCARVWVQVCAGVCVCVVACVHCHWPISIAILHIARFCVGVRCVLCCYGFVLARVCLGCRLGPLHCPMRALVSAGVSCQV